MSDLDSGRAHATRSDVEKPNSRIPAGLRRGLSLDRFLGVYLLVLLLIVFSVMLPDTFANADNFRVMAASQAIAGILTLGLVISLISGVFDISIAANMSLCISLVGWLQAERHVDWRLAVLLTLATGAFVGVCNAVVITWLHVDPIIATLGMSAILAAAAFWVANGQRHRLRDLTSLRSSGCQSVPQTRHAVLVLRSRSRPVVVRPGAHPVGTLPVRRRLQRASCSIVRTTGGAIAVVRADPVRHVGCPRRNRVVDAARCILIRRRSALPASRVRFCIPRIGPCSARSLQRARHCPGAIYLGGGRQGPPVAVPELTVDLELRRRRHLDRRGGSHRSNIPGADTDMTGAAMARIAQSRGSLAWPRAQSTLTREPNDGNRIS